MRMLPWRAGSVSDRRSPVAHATTAPTRALRTNGAAATLLTHSTSGGQSMFGWFRSKAECPVDPATRAWVDQRWDWLEGQFGLERLCDTPVVLPRPEFFPDAYQGTEEDVRRMLDRVCEDMYIDPTVIELSR